jgi:hypothetical protein
MESSKKDVTRVVTGIEHAKIKSRDILLNQPGKGIAWSP